jgi:hypothetical protein
MYKNINIGDLVKDNGIVVGIVTPFLYLCSSKDRNLKEYCDNAWGEAWTDSNLAYVYFEKGVKPFSIEEFKEFSQHIKEEFLESEYEKVLKVNILCIPFNKLELEEDKANE